MSSGGFPSGAGFANLGDFNADMTQQFGAAEITKSASANVKSAWFQVGQVGASGCNALLLRLIYLNNSGSDTGVQWDIGIGPAGSQIVLIPNVNQGQPSGTPQTNIIIFQHVIPVSIPAGTIIWARAAVNVASSTPHLACSCSPINAAFGSDLEFAGVDAIGVTATGKGTALTGAANAKGAYVSLIPATARNYCGFFLTFDYAGTVGSVDTQIDLAIGASGSQHIIVPDLVIGPNVGFSAVDCEFLPIPIPAGTQIWARSANNDGSTSKIGVSLYGVYQ
jgi:hypothetical protein